MRKGPLDRSPAALSFCRPFPPIDQAGSLSLMAARLRCKSRLLPWPRISREPDPFRDRCPRREVAGTDEPARNVDQAQGRPQLRGNCQGASERL